MIVLLITKYSYFTICCIIVHGLERYRILAILLLLGLGLGFRDRVIEMVETSKKY